MTGAEIIGDFLTQYGDRRDARIRIARPSTSIILEKIQQSREMVMAHRRFVIDEVAFSLKIRKTGHSFFFVQTARLTAMHTL